MLTQKDLSSNGFGQPWGHTRSYSNRLSSNPTNAGISGASWFVKELPQIVQASASAFVVVGVIGNAIWFDLTGGVYQARFFILDTLTADTVNNQLIYEDRTGRQFIFYDFSPANPAALQGQFVSFTDPYGLVTPAVYTGNQITSFTQLPIPSSSSSSSSSGSGGTPSVNYTYTYLTTGNNAGRLNTVTQSRGTISVRRIQHAYYDTGASHGSLGDLQSITQLEFNGANWDTLGTTYHRYYQAGDPNGFVHGLKYLVSPATYETMLNLGITPEMASDAVLALYADLYFEYDSNQRVTLMRESNAYTWTYAYAASGTGGSDYNVWQTKTTETLPDGNQNIVYTNFAGQVILSVFQSGGSNWCQYYIYDSKGRTIQFAESSAVVYTASPFSVSLQPTTGLIHVYDYYTATTANTTTAGGVLGYIQDEKVQRGSGGGPILLKSWQYIASGAVGSTTVYPLASETVYQNDSGGGSNPATTIFNYSWYSATLQVMQKTTGLPIIPTTQNGDGNTYTRLEYYDVYGQLTWRLDELNRLTFTQYDNASGTALQTIQDVDTSLSNSPQPPFSYTPPSGSFLNLITDYTIDTQGRVTQTLGPAHNVSLSGASVSIRRASWTVYQDVLGEVWQGAGYLNQTSGSFTLINPVQITISDGSGRTTDQIAAVRSSISGPLMAGDSFPQNSWVRWSRNNYGVSGILLGRQLYFLIPPLGPGMAGINYNETDYMYDAMRRVVREQSPGGTITWTVYSPQGNVLQTWIGTNDIGATLSNPGGGGAPNNMVMVNSNVYDGGAAGGDRNLTSATLYVDSTTSRVTLYGYDFRNRQISIDGQIDFYQTQIYDNQDRVVQVDRWNTYQGGGSSSSSSSSSGSSGGLGNLIGRSQTFFDNLSRVYQTKVFAVDPGTGTVGNSLTSNNYYDGAGNAIEQQSAGSSAFNKSFYDGIRRVTLQYTGYTITSPAGDVVMSQTEITYDAASNIIEQLVRDRFHNAPASGSGSTGLLTNPSGADPKARVGYVANWPDPLGRVVATANYGTNNGTVLTRPDIIPAPSATVLLTTIDYNNRGEADLVTDPAGTVTQSSFDDAGRLITRVDDYSTSTGHLNRETDYTYNPDGQIATLKAKNATTNDQVTTYAYGSSPSTSDIASNALLASVTYPDSTGGSDVVTFAYNRQGQIKTQTDQLGTVHALLYDLLGRQTHDCVTTPGSGVDGAVRRISFTYEVRGMVVNVTSYNNATVGSGSIVNDVQHVYNTFSQLVTQYQSHSGAVNTGLTPNVQYGYANGSANTIRPTSITYPNGRVINLNYGTAGAMNDQLSRISSLIDSDGTSHLADYTYVGLNRIVQVNSVQPGTALTYIQQGGSPPIGDGGDQYTGWDRFSRVIDQRWILTSTVTDLERIQYGFDQASNRLYRANLVAEGLSAAQDEYYTYDTLYQLLTSQRGTLNTLRNGISAPSREEDFTLDPTGNWNTYVQKVAGVTTLNQGRTHNQANELTQINGSTTYIAENAAGNITTAPQTGNWLAGLNLVYDAWNRLVSVSNAGSSSSSSSSSGSSGTVAAYQYDGLNRRVVNTTSTTRHYFYTQAWQIVEERVGTGTTADRQFVWGLRYLDDLVLRDAGTQRFYALHDYFNCTAIVDTTGAVQERYGYNAFGQVRFLTATFGSLTASGYTWETLYAAYRYDAESGFYQVRNRYLHPTLGRWLTRDPLGYADGMNLYAYSLNDPTNTVDPMGLSSTLSFKIVGKSFIALIGAAIGTAPPGGSQPALNAFAAVTDVSYNEVVTSDAKDKGYRLYSERTFNMSCDDAGNLTCNSRGNLNIDGGLEPTKWGPYIDPLVSIVSTSSSTSNNVFSFSWKIHGRPLPMFETPFTAVKLRTCWYIWHQIDGTIQCQNGQPVASVSISGSSFPTAYAIVNNAFPPASVFTQGAFNSLWNCSATTPIEIL